MSMFKNYLWDFDGTLFDSYPHMADSLILGLKELGIEPDQEEVMREMKITVNYAVEYFEKKYGIPHELKELYRKYEKAEPRVPVQPFPGVVELLKEINAHGGGNYLYTHRGLSSIEYLKKYDMETLFQDYITAQDKFPSKPAPNAILHLIEKNKLKKEVTVMVGDRDLDVDAGLNAGIAGILFDPGHYYDAYETKYRVTSMKEINRFI